MIPISTDLKVILFDWGDTLMSEDGPPDYTMADWPHVRAIEGAGQVLAALAGRYRLAIATNATISKRPDIARALQRVGLAGFIDEIFCFTELGRRKDDPVFWRIVLERLRVKATEAVMIGDSLEHDVFGPQRAGVAAVWFNGKNQPMPVGREVTAISRLVELPALLLARHAQPPSAASGSA